MKEERKKRVSGSEEEKEVRSADNNRKKESGSSDSRRVGKRDILVLVILAIVLLAIYFGYHALHRSADTDAQAVITVDGKTYGTYPLDRDQTVSIRNTGGKETNRLRISGGKAKMIYADCPDKICMHEQAIDADQETIVCLPNKVVVTVRSSKKSDIDSVAQ